LVAFQRRPQAATNHSVPAPAFFPSKAGKYGYFLGIAILHCEQIVGRAKLKGVKHTHIIHHQK
jgi:hypothetical protein